MHAFNVSDHIQPYFKFQGLQTNMSCLVGESQKSDIVGNVEQLEIKLSLISI